MRAENLTPNQLYERTVQNPVRIVDFLLALHRASAGGEPTVLCEDFAGSAAISRAWVERVAGGRAVAVDRDGASLAAVPHPRVATHVLDVRAPEIASLGPADVVHAGNFSIGELHARSELVGWARSARRRLVPGGIVALDTYGGESAWRLGTLERRRIEPDGSEIRWLWEQRSADPRTAEVVNTISFRVLHAGEVVLDLPDAFVYRWRLWSIPEIADALRDAGFAAISVHTRLDDPRTNGERAENALHSSCVALVVGR